MFYFTSSCLDPLSSFLFSFLYFFLSLKGLIRKGRQRIGEEEEKAVIAAVIDPSRHPELQRISLQLDKLISDVEALGELGEIDNALMLMQTVDTLEKSREKIITSLGGTLNVEKAQETTTKKLRVCDICGSFLSVFDSDKRLADHFLGENGPILKVFITFFIIIILYIL